VLLVQQHLQQTQTAQAEIIPLYLELQLQQLEAVAAVHSRQVAEQQTVLLVVQAAAV
jgi:hypothetical protein